MHEFCMLSLNALVALCSRWPALFSTWAELCSTRAALSSKWAPLCSTGAVLYSAGAALSCHGLYYALRTGGALCSTGAAVCSTAPEGLHYAQQGLDYAACVALRNGRRLENKGGRLENTDRSLTRRVLHRMSLCMCFYLCIYIYICRQHET
jgi:hypothetical protein